MSTSKLLWHRNNQLRQDIRRGRQAQISTRCAKDGLDASPGCGRLGRSPTRVDGPRREYGLRKARPEVKLFGHHRRVRKRMARSCGAAGRAEHGDARAESAPLKLAFEHGVSALGMAPRSDRVEHHDTPSYMRPEATSALSIDRCSPHWGGSSHSVVGKPS